MAQVRQIMARLNISPPLPKGSKASLLYTPEFLVQRGYNMLVSISIASSVKDADQTVSSKTVTVMGHFDTGASKTSIATELAEYIGLTAVGMSSISTANGPSYTPDYAVDISFPNTKLSPFINLPIGSCKLPFKIESSGEISLEPQNIGLLIGRDIMSRWNIVWNGPTSAVFISD